LERIAAGDENAFTTFYRRYQNRIYRFALQMSGRTNTAEEVTHEVFMAIDHWEQGEQESESVREERSRTIDPLWEFTQEELVETVRRAVSTLPPIYREVIVLCELQELSYQEAAAAAGCAVGTIRSRLHRVRELLLRRLSGEPAARSVLAFSFSRRP
jgi:RNA polymerase sigma-70 factor (ECF subfamily)